MDTQPEVIESKDAPVKSLETLGDLETVVKYLLNRHDRLNLKSEVQIFYGEPEDLVQFELTGYGVGEQVNKKTGEKSSFFYIAVRPNVESLKQMLRNRMKENV